MSEHEIGKFCSVAKKDTIIIPKDIPGYVTPEGQVLKEDGQKFNFIYTPIKYNITYNMNEGISSVEYKKTYTIEDEDYIPEDPTREDYQFIGWTPEKISKGSMGDIVLTANWKPNAILATGPNLNKALATLAGSKEAIMAIQFTNEEPEKGIDISCTDTPIFASFSEGIIYLYSENTIYCNLNMRTAFSGFTLLRDISALNEFICKENTDISGLFENCSMLSDVTPVSKWANSGKFSNFLNAFKGTLALSSGRVPTWYKWSVKIVYKSSTGVILKEVQEDRIPGEVVYASSFNGYRSLSDSIEITSPEIEYLFEYEPICYNINYILDGGELNNPKVQYTIEDETYYPAEPVKSGYKFVSWAPECITHGEFGNMTFIANYRKII